MQWISVEDRKPPNDVYVLVAKYDGRSKVQMHFIMIASRMGIDWFDSHNGDRLDPKYGYITHWMPLPTAPKSTSPGV